MTALLAAPAAAGLDLTSIQSIRAGYAGLAGGSGLPVVTVTELYGPPRVFEFRNAVARDRFLLLLVDACELYHSADAA